VNKPTRNAVLGAFRSGFASHSLAQSPQGSDHVQKAGASTHKRLRRDVKKANAQGIS